MIESRHPDTEVEIVTIKTSGDKGNYEVLGAFVKEIQESLLANQIDVAQHCLKDLPTQRVPGLTFAAHLPREDATDAIITRGQSWTELPEGAVIGTGSVRRTSQLAALRPDVQFKPLTGNVDTRMRKLQEGTYDAIVLATAGLRRLGVLDRWAESEYAALRIEPLDILPAAGQAVLVLEVAGGSAVEPLISVFNDHDTEAAATAERAFLRHFGTGCSVPVAAQAVIRGGLLVLEGLVASPNGRTILRGVEEGSRANAEQIGIELAQCLCAQGARDLIPGDVGK
jgi:hydroxymethylbilane synthase